MPNPNPPYRALIKSLTEQGYSAPQIADRLGISKRRVVSGRAALGISKPRGIPFTEEEHRRICGMLEDGLSIPEIGRTIGRSPDVLWRKYKGMSKGRSLCDTIKLRKQLGLLLT